MKNLFSVCSLAVFILMSCQKEYLDEPVYHDPADSIYIDKIYFASKANAGAEADTNTIISYSYDSRKRVSQISSGSNWTTFYFYNGTDTLPYKKTKIAYDLGISNPLTNDTSTVFYWYGAANANVKDSTWQSVGNAVPGGTYTRNRYAYIKTYRYVADSIYILNIRNLLYSSLPEPTTPVVTEDSIKINSNGNPLYYKSNQLPIGIPRPYRQIVYTYDDKVNPLSKLSNFKTLAVGSTDIDEDVQSVNNWITRRVRILPGTYDLMENFTGNFIYNSINLPVKLEYRTPTGTYNLKIFTYKSL
jgi:hypothetical protein